MYKKDFQGVAAISVDHSSSIIEEEGSKDKFEGAIQRKYPSKHAPLTQTGSWEVPGEAQSDPRRQRRYLRRQGCWAKKEGQR